MDCRLRKNPIQKTILAFVGYRHGAVAVAFTKAKGHGAFFGVVGIFLKFPFRDCVEGLFIHVTARAFHRRAELCRKLLISKAFSRACVF